MQGRKSPLFLHKAKHLNLWQVWTIRLQPLILIIFLVCLKTLIFLLLLGKPLESVPIISLPILFHSTVCLLFFFFFSNLSTIESPKNVHGALGNKNWRDAMNEEMHALIKNGTWEMIRAS